MRPGSALRRTPSGGFVFPQFLPAFDAVATLVRLLSLLASGHRVLSRVVASLAEDRHRPAGGSDAVRAEGPRHADPRRAGRSRRSCSCSTGSRSIDANGWTLVLPDPETPVTHIHAEGEDQGRGRASGSSGPRPTSSGS